MPMTQNRMTLSDLSAEQKTAAEKYARWGIRKITNCQPIDEEQAREFGRKLMAAHGRWRRKVVIVQSPFGIVPGKRGKAICHALQQCRDFMMRRAVNHLTFPLRLALLPRNASKYLVEKSSSPLAYGTFSVNPLSVYRQMESNGVATFNNGSITWELLEDIVDEDLWKWFCRAIINPVRRRAPNILCENCDIKTVTRFVSLNGQVSAPQAAVMKYLREVCGVELNVTRELEEQVEFGGVYMYHNHIVICQRPSYIEPMFNGLLHRDGGGVIEYSDGFGFYALNNVLVPEWLAVGKAEDIDPALFATIDNVDVRREFLRKVGVERVYQKLGGTSIDRRGEYELVRIYLGDRVGMWPYLKMINPSIGVWHLEAVPKDTRTVGEALIWRNGTAFPPSQLT